MTSKTTPSDAEMIAWLRNECKKECYDFDMADAITDRLSALQAKGGGWRSIETAPKIDCKDGCVNILCLCGPEHHPITCFWWENQNGWYSFETMKRCEPTHWTHILPFKAAPQPAASAAQGAAPESEALATFDQERDWSILLTVIAQHEGVTSSCIDRLNRLRAASAEKDKTIEAQAQAQRIRRLKATIKGLRAFIESITHALGPYPYLDGTSVVSDAYKALEKWGTK